jgi:hypothetical protein
VGVSLKLFMHWKMDLLFYDIMYPYVAINQSIKAAINQPSRAATLLSPTTSLLLTSLVRSRRTVQLRLPKRDFRNNMSSPAIQAARMALANIDLSKYDPEQSRLMDERCIVVDEQDNAIGALDKKTCTSSYADALCSISVSLVQAT